MAPTSGRKVAWLLSVGLLLAVLSLNGLALAQQETGAKNVVLVHGAWADGSSWSKVIPILQAAGLQVVAVQNPMTSFAADVETTRRAIAWQDGPVLLVGHSYGGAVITEAGNDSKVAGLVYVAAFAPDDGQSLNELSRPFPPTPGLRALQVDASGFARLTPTALAENHCEQ